HPKSFVWDYFDKDNNGMTVTCKEILDNGKKCGVLYNNGSTTSNLINHLAQFKEALLVLQRVLYPHTGEGIAELLDNVLVEWGLINKMTAITTDNGSNIKKAAQLLELDRIPCAAHVLQLSVGKGAIVYLPSWLQSDESVPVRKDSERLACIMLSDDEWIFLDELNDILYGFEEIMMLLSRNTYVTISLMYPAISTLVKTLKILLQQSYIESASADMGKLTILDSVEEIIDDTKDIVEIKKVDASLGIIYKTINISVPIITIGMLEKVKKLRFANTNVVIQTKEHLKSLYELECEIHLTPKHPMSLSNIQHDDYDDFEAATSVLFEQLFSDVGNNITPNRTNLDSEL
ncbi:3031_t:CDS:2, partial [Cetraspora pellucida]